MLSDRYKFAIKHYKMDNTKTILVRNIPFKYHVKLEKIAKRNRLSVNFIVIEAIESYLLGYKIEKPTKSIK